MNTASHNQPPKDSFWSQEFVQYPNGHTHLLFRGKGDRIVWGGHKYANPMFSSIDRVLVRTETGNTYAIGAGVIVNTRENAAQRLEKLPQGLPEIVIGESWRVPGFCGTTAVKAVLLQYRIGEMGGQVVDKPDPFVAAEALIQLAGQHLPQ